MPQITLVYVWPDGTWCEFEDIDDMTHMSDDYEGIYLNEEQYDKFVETGNLP